MRITFEAVRGYVLEELLARLLQDNGYQLLVSEDQDPDALRDSSKGLLVRGRGSDHQVDALGELDLPLPFSLPLRLFVEAKHRSSRPGIRDVRNAYGTIHDVNQHYAAPTAGLPVKRYQYHYALFSANGFSLHAQKYALIHQISLVDLSHPGFSDLLEDADRIATEIHDLAIDANLRSLPLNQIRHALRHALGTWPHNVEDESFPDLADRIRQLRETRVGPTFVPPAAGLAVAEERRRHGLDAPRPHYEQFAQVAEYFQAWAAIDEDDDSEPSSGLPTSMLAGIVTDLGTVSLSNLVLGFPAAPFVLVLLVDNMAAFAEYVDDPRHSDIPVRLEATHTQRRGRPTSDAWTVVPTDDTAEFRLNFTVPAVHTDWMQRGGLPVWSTGTAGSPLQSSIAIMRGNRVVRLLYQPHGD